METQKENTISANKATFGMSGGASAQTARDRGADGGNGRSTSATNDSDVLGKAKETANTLLDQAKAGAGDAYEAVADKASLMVKDQKTELTGGLTGVADTVRRISGAISEGTTNNGVTEYAAQYTETAARKLENAAQYFERTDLKGMARDVESYAKRNPAIFLGAAFALGVLAARLIKSSPSPSAESTDSFAAGDKSRELGASAGSL